MLPGKRARGCPPKVPGKVPGVSAAGQTSELVRLRWENELLKGKVGLLEDQVAEQDTQLAAVRGERQRADALLKERDSQLLAEHSAAMKAESAWRTREKKLLDEVEAARGQRWTKRTPPEPVAVQEGVAEEKAWLTQCAVELRTGLRQATTATAVLEDSLKRVDKEAVPPPSSSAALDALLMKYDVGDILQPPRKKGTTEPGTPTVGSPRSQGSGVR